MSKFKIIFQPKLARILLASSFYLLFFTGCSDVKSNNKRINKIDFEYIIDFDNSCGGGERWYYRDGFRYLHMRFVAEGYAIFSQVPLKDSEAIAIPITQFDIIPVKGDFLTASIGRFIGKTGTKIFKTSNGDQLEIPTYRLVYPDEIFYDVVDQRAMKISRSYIRCVRD